MADQNQAKETGEAGKAHWLEASLTVDPEMGEAVAEVMSRFVSNGVVVESGVVYNDAEDEGTPVGPVRVYGYLAVDDAIEETRQRLEEALWYLGRIRPLPEVSFKVIQDEDWMAAWKQHYHPIPIGQRLLILPAWLESPYPQRLAVKIDPSMAFGTGTHPTTQLCLELLERTIQPGQLVIDVGCGSGILSIAAIKLGARRALAVDIDNAAVQSTLENGTANGVADAIERGLGSVTEIRANTFSFSQAPVVVANILAPIIIRLFNAELADLVEPGGQIILSGILAEQADDVSAAAQAHGIKEIERLQSGDWVAILGNREL